MPPRTVVARPPAGSGTGSGPAPVGRRCRLRCRAAPRGVGGGVRVGAPRDHLAGQCHRRRAWPPRWPNRARSAARAIVSISLGGAAFAATASAPCSSMNARCLSSASITSSMPSPSGGDGLDDRRPPQSRLGAVAEGDHVPQVAHGRVGAVAVGLVDDEDVADLEDAGLGRLDAVAHARARAARRWCRRGRRPRPRTGRRRPSRRARRRSRPRRAPAAPAASSTTGRRGGRARPSSGCRPRGRGRGPASGSGRRAAHRRRTARTGRRRARRPAARARGRRRRAPLSSSTCRRRASR